MHRVLWSSSKNHAYWVSPSGATSWQRPESVAPSCYDDASSEGRVDTTEAAGAVDQLRINSNRWKQKILRRTMPRSARVLDLACGRGGDLTKFANLHAKSVVGIDASARALETACERALSFKSMDVRLYFADVRADAIAIDHVCDIATCMFALHYLVDTREATIALARTLDSCLSPHGKFVGVAPDSRQIALWLAETDEATIGDAIHLSWVKKDSEYRCRILGTAGALVDAVETCINWPMVEDIFEREASLVLRELCAPPQNDCQPMWMYSSFVFERKYAKRVRSRSE